MAHVELSVSELNAGTGLNAGTERGASAESSASKVLNVGNAASVGTAGHPVGLSLERWAAAVLAADEFCLVLDAEAVVVAISPSFERLLGLDRSPIGRDLLDGVLDLVDFADGGPMIDGEISKIPPLLALTSGRLARGLLRVDSPDGQCTLDAVATPLVTGDHTVGSLTFFSPI